jgi:hypothetical protein
MRATVPLLLALLLALLVVAGCQGPALIPAKGFLRSPAPMTCEADLRDQPCVSCLKTRCCALAQASTGGSQCAADCANTNNTKACAATCPTPQERALADCMASACDCPGGRP